MVTEKSAQSAVTMHSKQTKEELIQHLKTIADIYCENDFLIPGSSVDGLVLKYQQMNFASAKVKACSDYLVTSLRCEDNGYKSLQTVKNKLVEVASSKARHIVSKVANVNEVKKFLAFWTKSFDTMIVILETALELLNLSSPGCLFPAKPDCRSEEIVNISRRIMNLDVSCFYGEIQSFHLRGDCKYFTRFLHSLMVFYCDNLEFNLASIKKIMHSLRCLTDQNLLGKKIVNISREVDILEAQQFWMVGESPQAMAFKPISRINTSAKIKIPLENVTIRGATIHGQFLIPSCVNEHKDHVPARFIADFRTPDMVGSCYPRVLNLFRGQNRMSAPRKTLMLNVHGGGFIAQTPTSHIDYLHQWSKDLNMPIVSIEYSLAPQHPYPRAVQEVFYSYVWCLEHPEKLGWTGEKVIVSGDSAGGNMVAGLVIQCILQGVRVPDGLHLNYACLLAQFYPSPSRLMMLMDPLLMVGVLGKCINAYKDSNYLKSLPRSLEQELQLGTSEDDLLLSPLVAEQEILKHFPPTLFIETDADACLDENIQFRSNLTNAQVKTRLEMIRGLPHGFLAFCGLSMECQKGVETVSHVLKHFIAEL